MAAVTAAATEGNDPTSRLLNQYDQEIADLRSQVEQIHTSHAAEQLPEEQRAEWNRLNEELDKKQEARDEFKARADRLAAFAPNEEAQERGADFQTRHPSAVTGDDIYDLSTVRSRSDDPHGLTELRDRAMRELEGAEFPHERADKEHAQGHIERMLRTIDYQADGKVGGELARRMLVTGNPLYSQALGKYIKGHGMNADEQRALSEGTGSAGGYAIVYTLDPTVVPTSNFSVNPFRAIARVEPISGTNEWRAITSGAITAAYAAEGTEASDNAPTLAQPDIFAERAQAFVPFSIELAQDWAALQTEMASLLQDAKDDLEATKFALGAGHGSNEPKGIITAATNTTTAGGTAAFAIADLYKVFEALPARFRPRAQWMGHLFALDKIRQFDTAGGSGVWIDPMGVNNVRGLGPQADAAASGTVSETMIPKLLNRNVWESTAMDSALTTGKKILVIGDWRYFVIVERVGMDIEILPQLLGSNRRPTGQRGLYAFWRNSSDALSASAFQVLVTG